MPLEKSAILLVEDEPLIAMDLSTTLEAFGARVYGPVRSVKDAIQLMDDPSAMSTYDAVILDYSLVDGVTGEVARRLDELGIPFIYHTANSGVVEPLAAHLGVPFVSKPASDQDLMEALQRVTA